MRIRLIPRTVRGLSILVAIVSTLVMLPIGAAIVLTAHEEIERQIDHRVLQDMEVLLDYRENHSPEEFASLIEARTVNVVGEHGYLAGIDDARGVVGYMLADKNGQRLAGLEIMRPPTVGWEEFLRFRRADGTRGVAQALTRRLPDGGYLVVAGDRASLRQTDNRIITLLLAGLGAILLTGILSTIALGRLVHRRLSAISQTAQGIVEGDFSRRVPIDGSGSEFDQLSHILNAMLDRIDALMRNLRQLSSDIAHDMRTPLTRIRNQMDQMLHREDREPSIQAMQRLIADADSLLDLFTGLLGVSEIEGLGARKRFRPVRVDLLVEKVAEAYRPNFHDEDRYLELVLQPCEVRGDEQLLMGAVANLLENVLAHAGPGAGVHIDMFVDGDILTLRIADDGVGIPPGSETAIFERLTRLDPSRGTPGHGLGLSMVRAITLLHRGTVEADTKARGLTIQMRLPIDTGKADG